MLKARKAALMELNKISGPHPYPFPRGEWADLESPFEELALSVTKWGFGDVKPSLLSLSSR